MPRFRKTKVVLRTVNDQEDRGEIRDELKDYMAKSLATDLEQEEVSTAIVEPGESSGCPDGDYYAAGFNLIWQKYQDLVSGGDGCATTSCVMDVLNNAELEGCDVPPNATSLIDDYEPETNMVDSSTS